MSRVIAFGLVLVAAACSADGGQSEGESGSGTSSAAQGTGGATAATTGSATGGDITLGNGGGGGDDGGGGDCAAVSSEAELEIAPADIIIAVDTSGSMDAEAGWTQNNLPSFVSAITASGIDAHVVLIADSDMCVPQPLGSGSCGCADEQLPAYRHVCDGVGSENAFDKILATYPQWSPSLRPGATKTIAVVSDDDANMNWGTFQSQMIALDASFNGFKFDAIVSSADPFVPGPCFLLSAAAGTEYINLVNATAGVYGDLCGQNFGPVFQDMATAVINNAAIACEIDIPEPPVGEMLDPNKVNVEYTPAGGTAQPLYNVPGGEAACDNNGGWYYDDPQNPTQIILCPASCTVVQSGAAGAKIDVLFGCGTEVGPPA